MEMASATREKGSTEGESNKYDGRADMWISQIAKRMKERKLRVWEDDVNIECNTTVRSYIATALRLVRTHDRSPSWVTYTLEGKMWDENLMQAGVREF